MSSRSKRAHLLRSCVVVATLVALFTAAVPVRAARPLLDSGKWNNYFALFARDTDVPWKPISVRLDTYSGAPVDFAAYAVDPANVLVAGASSRPRAIDTSHLTPVARWRFTPPPGLVVETNDVDVPLQNREGFYVIEARRGDAVQQVWVNVTRVGLVTKEAPGNSLLYATDLGNGSALAGMRIAYLVRREFAYAKTDAHGISHVPAGARFALANWGKSLAFVSLLPQSPQPAAVVAVRVDRAVLRAGETVRAIGFGRRRVGQLYRPASGEVGIGLVERGRTLATTHATLDRAGAFSVELAVPANAAAGDAVVLASIPGASGGASLHVDAVGDVNLSVAAPCTTECPAAAPLDLTVAARRDGAAAPNQALEVDVVRVPHVLDPDAPSDQTVWGTTTVLDQKVTTGAAGTATVTIPAPSDGLASTYTVRATSGASTATLQLVAPTAAIALAVHPERDAIDVGQGAAIVVRGFDALAGTPAAGTSVVVSVKHGPDAQQQTVTLDAQGSAHVLFRDLAPGMNLVAAQAQVGGRTAFDVAAVTVAPQALGATGGGGETVKVTLDRGRVHPGERIGVSASLPGSVGVALLTIESSRGATPVVVPVRNGSAGAYLTVPDTLGAIAVGAAFVHDGAVVTGTLPLAVDGPGHERSMTLSLDRPNYAPGATAQVELGDGGDRTGATVVIRMSDRLPGSGATFDDIPGVLATSGLSTQNAAASDPPWHAWVAPARSTAADIFGFDRPRQGAAAPISLAGGARVLSWQVDRTDRDVLDLKVPAEPGRYVLSVVKMTDDGDVGAASVAVAVR